MLPTESAGQDRGPAPSPFGRLQSAGWLGMLWRSNACTRGSATAPPPSEDRFDWAPYASRPGRSHYEAVGASLLLPLLAAACSLPLSGLRSTPFPHQPPPAPLLSASAAPTSPASRLALPRFAPLQRGQCPRGGERPPRNRPSSRLPQSARRVSLLHASAVGREGQPHRARRLLRVARQGRHDVRRQREALGNPPTRVLPAAESGNSVTWAPSGMTFYAPNKGEQPTLLVAALSSGSYCASSSTPSSPAMRLGQRWCCPATGACVTRCPVPMAVFTR
jgi:hypothetical protein